MTRWKTNWCNPIRGMGGLQARRTAGCLMLLLSLSYLSSRPLAPRRRLVIRRLTANCWVRHGTLLLGCQGELSTPRSRAASSRPGRTTTPPSDCGLMARRNCDLGRGCQRRAGAPPHRWPSPPKATGWSPGHRLLHPAGVRYRHFIRSTRARTLCPCRTKRVKDPCTSTRGLA